MDDLQFKGKETFADLGMDKSSANMCEDAYQAISDTQGGWQFLKDNTPPSNGGFMFWDDKPQIMKDIDKNLFATPTGGGHSGASYGCCMREMHYIAHNGWEKYKKEVLKNKVAN